ncbi:hypothetical protein COCSUDRAFT_53105 [Coccomyxa subellipsoidea C-169]|uniref:Uncharacterized protein n=1 Tax=Coccomyxa subellipsoidea (strain C-169) TaxID=574566 RepID=I0Z2K0_COCSC|nr:hypothetical protein COCSUDRAFT_53105 [Coccomyxa subellipsoidea C-169]EIE24869.1 hypothetical protein COCSUDRAFT_53105 [Coccomyxa subellipsoidea C-169]|eukprot:XP_005649413.1 hypothetical protein COCSUDRAFT_53105 [Coccomyxa subellipsoidea C-169]
MVQRHKGWQFGYLASNATRRMTYLNWVPAEAGLPRDGRWSCGTHDYPSMHHSLMHPCAGTEGGCCGNTGFAPFLLRYESFFHSTNALLVLAYEVWPICGDGMDFVVRLKPNGPRRAQTLLKRAYDADPNAQPNRQKIEWRMHIRTGDVLDFTVEPRGNHDCDGLYIVDVQIWIDDFAQSVEW